MKEVRRGVGSEVWVSADQLRHLPLLLRPIGALQLLRTSSRLPSALLIRRDSGLN